MLRTFSYTFDPFAGGPIKGNSAELAVDEIENAGLLEVLQTPGASLGSWAFLNELLVQTGPGTPFVFKEPLGQAREVKVALSGLFGRFVARAYLERYFNLSIFAHLGRRSFRLDRRMRITIKRKKASEEIFRTGLQVIRLSRNCSLPRLRAAMTNQVLTKHWRAHGPRLIELMLSGAAREFRQKLK
jgi:hypothetical protein